MPTAKRATRGRAGRKRKFGSTEYHCRNVIQRIIKHPFLLVSSLVLLLLLFGTGGYMVIERWSFLDSLYMTVITMTTIGYGEVKTLSQPGRLFTIGLIVIGVVAASYAVTTVVELFTSQEFLQQIRDRRRRKALQKLSHHCIICGFGRLGRNLAKEMQARQASLIVIDSNEEAIEACNQLGYEAIQGNAADERVLYEAGIERADSLVAAVRSDADNVFIVLTAKSLRPDLQVISRCNSESTIPKLEKAGAETVISPYAIAGRRIAHLLTRPNVTQFLDGILEFGDHQMRLEEFIVSEDSPLAGLTLSEAKLEVAVLAVTHPEQPLLTHPNANTKLLPGAAIIVMGVDQKINKLAQII